MTPAQASIIVPLSVLAVMFAVMGVNIYFAKKKVKQWTNGTVFTFVNTLGMFGIGRRSSLVWMKKYGYDKCDADVLAGYQCAAIFELCVVVFALFVVAANTTAPQ